MHLGSPQKILIVRFSSIGDIVLTFSVAATIKDLFPQCKVDFVTKPQFKALLAACPELDTIYILNGSVKALRKEIDFSQYDAVLDLHHNLRTRIFLRFLSGKVYRFPKNNLQKWLLTTFKIRPKNHTHVIERYLMPLFSYLKSKHIGQEPKFLVPDYARIDIKEAFNLAPKSYVAIAIGAQFATKRLPTDLLIELVKKINNPILLLGGKEDETVANDIIDGAGKNDIYSAAARASIHESAWLIKNAKCLVSHDTGLMHIGATFDIPLFVVWGNTTPDFGMYPYRKDQKHVWHFQVEDLSCRPCSKIGHDQCPKRHFKCMRNQNTVRLAKAVNDLSG